MFAVFRSIVTLFQYSHVYCTINIKNSATNNLVLFCIITSDFEGPCLVSSVNREPLNSYLQGRSSFCQCFGYFYETKYFFQCFHCVVS